MFMLILSCLSRLVIQDVYCAENQSPPTFDTSFVPEEFRWDRTTIKDFSNDSNLIFEMDWSFRYVLNNKIVEEEEVGTIHKKNKHMF